MYNTTQYNPVLCHHGILGMKWGIRRYQNKDGTLTAAGKKRYPTRDGNGTSEKASQEKKQPVARKKKASEMTDEELKSKTNRMRLENDYNNALKTYKENEARNRGPSKTDTMKKVLSSLNTILNSAKKSEIESAKRADLKKAMDEFSKKNADEQKATNDRLIKQNIFQKNYAAVRDAKGFDAGKNSVLKTLAIAGGVVTTGLTALEIAEAISSMRKK